MHIIKDNLNSVVGGASVTLEGDVNVTGFGFDWQEFGLASGLSVASGAVIGALLGASSGVGVNGASIFGGLVGGGIVVGGLGALIDTAYQLTAKTYVVPLT
ncbi:MAG: hypothetical protein V4490_08450 [Pseudomonadota bacterium]